MKLPQALRDSYSATAFQDMLDRSYHAGMSRFTAGLSPAAMLEAYLDWSIHLALSPGKQIKLMEKAARKSLRLWLYAARCAQQNAHALPCIEPLAQDKRFVEPEWQSWPFNVAYQSFLLTQQWWSIATTNIPGMSQRQEKVVEFAARQFLDVWSPSNFLLTNPVALRQTLRSGGMNLSRGVQHFLEDWERVAGGQPMRSDPRFKVGENIAATPGKVVYRNELIELIQYEPTTESVHPEPILIVPAWIMKYYILDLSAHNSLVRYLVDQGFTVFMISWRNPGPQHRDFGMRDYRTLGVESARNVVSQIVPDTSVHAVGYCLGGTLLAVTAAAMARDRRNSMGSLSLLAAQTDFNEPGELELFINESQLSFLEDMMWEQGFLESRQMAGAFQLLRSNDLIWSRIVHDYLMGERAPMNDLMAWNADATRMPYRMHSEYLRWLFLNNDLAEGRYCVDDRPIALSDIRASIFAVGTRTDHVAPWRSVYKIFLLTDTEVTFVLTSGGHNAGIVSEPGHRGRTYQTQARDADALYVDPETWRSEQPIHEGSWWPEWVSWLKSRSGERAAPPRMGAPEAGLPVVCDAPGTYVFET